MTKASKQKKEIVETNEEAVTPIVPATEEAAEETSEVITEEIAVVEEPVPVTVSMEIPEKKTVTVSSNIGAVEIHPEATHQERIMKFLNGKSGHVKLNDFLKSLYPVAKGNEPPQWLQQGVSKQLRVLLEGMKQSEGLRFVNDMQQLLGKSYYTVPDQMQKHHNLADLTIEVML